MTNREGRSLFMERTAKHLRYWGAAHPYPCRTCAHPCPGRRCMTTLHDPYQVLCGFCSRTNGRSIVKPPLVRVRTAILSPTLGRVEP